MTPAALTVGLTADRKQLRLINPQGVEAHLPLLGAAEVMGAAVHRLDLRCEGLDELTRAARLDLLRTCRRLLTAGGTLRLPPDTLPALTDDAWLCGFQHGMETEDGAVRLVKPARGGGPGALVSILIPAYKPDHLALSLRSALDQTYANCEIVLCDDSGAAEVEAVVRAVAPDRVRYFRNPENLGGQANYLRCLAEARGRYIKFLNDDDVLAPHCVAAMAGCLDRNPAVTLVTSYRQLIDGSGRPLPDQPINRPLAPCDALFEGRHLATRLLTEKVNRIGEPTTAMFRKEDLQDNRPHLFSYDGTPARRNGDTFIWATLLSRGDAVYLAAPLSGFRQHQGQVQHDAGFTADARRVWDELAAQGRATGLVHPAFSTGPAPFPCPPEDWPAADFAADLTSPTVTSLLTEGNPTAAVLWLRSRLHQQPDSVRLRSDLGGVLWASGLPEAGLAESLLALRTVPDETTMLNLGDMLTVMGRGDQAARLGSVPAGAGLGSV